MSSHYSNQDYAMMLAGVFQAARLTFELAYTGQTDEQLLEAGIKTLFNDNPASVSELYGGADKLRKGLETFIQQLGPAEDRNPEVTQYSIRLLQLGHKLYKRPQAVAALVQDLEDYESRRSAFEFESSTRYSQLARIYQDHVSPLGPPIMVKGDPSQLDNNEVAARIRTALLTGVRSAYTWYQCGGRRWHLLTRQRRFLQAAHRLLENSGQESSA